MPYISGGDTDKRGNYYENKFVVSKFAELLNSELCYVQQETYILNEESGVDVIIKDKDSIKKFYKCKARNGVKDVWSNSDLIQNRMKNISDCHIHRLRCMNYYNSDIENYRCCL